MEIPSEVIEVIAPNLAKKRKPYTRRTKLTTKMLNAIGNGLRTTESISNAVNEDKKLVTNHLSKLMVKGLIVSKRIQGVREAKYYLNTEKPHLDLRNLDTPKPKRKYTRRQKVVAIPSSVWKGEKTVDVVNHPSHYKTGGIETIDFIEAKGLNYNLGNVIKYITRADHKGNRKVDLEKARWYLNRELDNLEK